MEKPERIIFILNESWYSVVITVCNMPSILKNIFFCYLNNKINNSINKKHCLDTNLSCMHNL